jgi:hypothetical protein
MASSLNAAMSILADPAKAREFLASMPFEQINRMFDMHREAGLKYGKEEYQREVICRLLASGMSAEEISVILCVKTELVTDIASRSRELVATYKKQLKGRRYRMKRLQDKPDSYPIIHELVNEGAADK